MKKKQYKWNTLFIGILIGALLALGLITYENRLRSVERSMTQLVNFLNRPAPALVPAPPAETGRRR